MAGTDGRFDAALFDGGLFDSSADGGGGFVAVEYVGTMKRAAGSNLVRADDKKMKRAAGSALIRQE